MRQLYRFVTIGFLFMSIPSAARADDELFTAVAAGGRFSLNGMSLFRAEGTPGGADTKYRQGLAFGVSSRIDIYDAVWAQVGMQLEASYVQRGAIIEANDVELGRDRMDYIDLPLLARASFHVAGPFRGHVAAGPRLSILLTAKSTDINGNVRDETDFYDGIDVGLSVGAGALVNLGSRTGLVLEVRYDQGVTNIDDTQENPGIRHRTIFFTVGVDWEIWRKRPMASAAAPR